jgi:hypothetical protein
MKMPSVVDHTDTHLQNSSSSHRKLLTPESFAHLCQIQAEIAQETGWQPSLSKLANALIHRDSLLALKKRMLMEFKNRDSQKRESSDF